MSLFKHTKHTHVLRNPNELTDDTLSFGQRTADAFAAGIGSWKFIIIQSVLMAIWITLNTVAWFMHYDSYPYVLLNLFLSCEAALSAPIIMMSQNRTAMKDRITAEEDYNVNRKGEHEIEQMIQHLDAQDTAVLKIDEAILKIVQEQAKHTELLLKLQQTNRKGRWS